MKWLPYGRQPSSRQAVLREGNRQGRVQGFIHLAPFDPREAQQLAGHAARGLVSNPRAIPTRWRSVFERAFVAAALKLSRIRDVRDHISVR